MNPIDLDCITHVCICGGNLWNVRVTFEDYEIASWDLNMTCNNCGAKAKTPTPIDHPDYRRDY